MTMGVPQAGASEEPRRPLWSRTPLSSSCWLDEALSVTVLSAAFLWCESSALASPTSRPQGGCCVSAPGPQGFGQ